MTRAPTLVTLLAASCGATLFLVAPTESAAQTVRGLVFDAVTGDPVPLATISLLSERGERVASVLTSDEGFFSIDADGEGRFLVRSVALGYRPAREGPIELKEDGLHVVEFRMTPAPVDLEGLVVEGERSGSVGNNLTQRGFWERYEEGRGQFLTPTEVLASDAVFTPQLLRSLDHIYERFDQPPWLVWPELRRANGLGRGPCSPRIYVDNVWVNRPGFGYAGTGLGLDDIVPLDRVQAVEVYWGPFQAPMKYQGTTMDNDCGVLLFWTGG
jgi:carboxypeptidase family protein